MKQFITEAQRLQKLAGITEAKVVPQVIPRRLKGQMPEKEWKSIGSGFDIDTIESNYDTDDPYTIFETPQSFRFSFDTPKSTKLSYNIRFDDYDQDVEEWIYDDIDELKRQLSNAGYKLEVERSDEDIMLYIPV